VSTPACYLQWRPSSPSLVDILEDADALRNDPDVVDLLGFNGHVPGPTISYCCVPVGKQGRSTISRARQRAPTAVLRAAFMSLSLSRLARVSFVFRRQENVPSAPTISEVSAGSSNLDCSQSSRTGRDRNDSTPRCAWYAECLAGGLTLSFIHMPALELPLLSSAIPIRI